MQLNLISHPETPPPEPSMKVWANVEYSASFGAMATANIWFGIDAPASQFRIPAPKEPEHVDGLWERTCFEAFLRRPGSDAYYEWNFAPSGDWAAYELASYRDGRTEAEVNAPPYIRVEDNLTWWALGATIAVESEGAWELGLSAILEDRDGVKSYWALAHPDAEKPDFHHPDCFVARLA